VISPKCKSFTFYFCPYLKQSVYFGLAPAVVEKPVTRGVKAAEEIHARQMEHYVDQENEDEVWEKPDSWSLSAEERLALGKVKEEFLSFERDGP